MKTQSWLHRFFAHELTTAVSAALVGVFLVGFFYVTDMDTLREINQTATNFVERIVSLPAWINQFLALVVVYLVYCVFVDIEALVYRLFKSSARAGNMWILSTIILTVALLLVGLMGLYRLVPFL